MLTTSDKTRLEQIDDDIENERTTEYTQADMIWMRCLLNDALRELDAGGWRLMPEAPTDGTAVWLLLEGQPYLGYCQPANWLCKENRWFAKSTFIRRGSPADRRATPTTDDVYGCYAIDVKPTMWMPLPAPPGTSDGCGE